MVQDVERGGWQVWWAVWCLVGAGGWADWLTGLSERADRHTAVGVSLLGWRWQEVSWPNLNSTCRHETEQVHVSRCCRSHPQLMVTADSLPWSVPLLVYACCHTVEVAARVRLTDRVMQAASKLDGMHQPLMAAITIPCLVYTYTHTYSALSAGPGLSSCMMVTDVECVMWPSDVVWCGVLQFVPISSQDGTHDA